MVKGVGLKGREELKRKRLIKEREKEKDKEEKRLVTVLIQLMECQSWLQCQSRR